MVSFKQTLLDIKNDFLNKENNLKSIIIELIYSARFKLLFNYRIGRWLSSKKFKPFKHLAAFYKLNQITKRNCDISYSAFIGKKVKMPHPLGIVIGKGVKIENNAVIFQNVSIGSDGKKSNYFRYPIIENNTVIYAGAKIIGCIRIGKNAIIGANSVVNKDVPANCTAIGVPCKILSKNKNESSK